MSDYFEVPSNIECCAGRTEGPLQQIFITPSQEGVFLVATDNTIIAVVESDGEVSEPRVAHSRALRAGVTMKASGNNWVPDLPTHNRKPKWHEKLPDIAGKSVITLDVKLLRRLAKALSESSDYLTLFVGGEEEPVGVLGNHGIGVVMPVAGDGVVGAAKRYEQIRQAAIASALTPSADVTK